MMLVLQVLALVAQAAAAPLPPDNAGLTTASSAAKQAARAAHQLRADATVAAALRSVGVVGKYEGGKDPTRETGEAADQALVSLGFGTALDLRLLAGAAPLELFINLSVELAKREYVNGTRQQLEWAINYLEANYQAHFADNDEHAREMLSIKFKKPK
eukprot:SAG22_NODE_72_length_22344_cov_95.586559_18_plen_158_part_00